ncbi:uncharacterized protein LOC127285366 [Leptopilina boulardi]|uniref:uncharacterized protein LOC127285366 n=1 Tax=Leptopilina boulardi TaxID=63433 RepID=UPI0021F5E297|nr:uncharacterized protein LOC127285366 [Leptopilina boulardi]
MSTDDKSEFNDTRLSDLLSEIHTRVMEPNFEQLLTTQYTDFKSIERHFKYIEDLEPQRKSALVIRNRCTLLESLWRTCRDRHALMTHCANLEQKQNKYFAEDEFGEKEIQLYSNLDICAELLAEIQPPTLPLAASSPNLNFEKTVQQSGSIVKLRRIELPVFSDPKTQRDWELKLSSSIECPAYSDLETFLLERIRALEALPAVTTNNSIASKPVAHSKDNFSKSNRANVNIHIASSRENSCFMCKEKYVYVKANRICTNCLRAQHKNNDCPSKFTCTKCKSRHHTLLHRETKSETEYEKESNDNSNQSSTGFQVIKSSKIQSHFSAPSATKSNNVLLATARVWVLSPSMRAIRVRALIDQGSTWTFASQDLTKMLNSKTIPISASLSGLGGSHAGNANSAVTIRISSSPNGDPVFNTQAIVIPKITSYVSQSNVNFEQWPHLKKLKLADDPYNNDPIHLLIGAELYGSIILDGLKKGRAGDPIAQNTIFGWVLSGSLSSLNNQNESSVQIHHCISNKSLDSCLQKFWEIEEINSKEIVSIEDELCEEHFQKTHSRTPDGQYSVNYPFTTDKPIDIGYTKKIAEKSLKRLETRLEKNPVHKELYSDFMEKYKTFHDMRKVKSLENPSNQVVYIPHQPVFREASQTTKMRAVFNASAPSTNGTSLNDHMRIGQKLQTNLFNVLVHWRVFKYVYTADIARMYRQILINLDDVDYQRILWRSSPDQPISEYQLLTVTYGTRSPPYLALRVLKQLVIDEGLAFPLASYVLKNNIYIDDAMFGGSSKREAKESRDEFIALLRKGHFTPRKWSSNCPQLLSDIDPSDHGLAWSSPLNALLKKTRLEWNPTYDQFQFTVKSIELEVITKRTILSVLAKLYDPVGWLSPIIITGKIIMQNLWRNQCSWDDNLDIETVSTWTDYVNSLNDINELTIPRWLQLHPDNLEVQIHGFADASEVAYGAVLYLRVTLSSHEVITQIITSKTKVAPVKQISIPRLELQAATLLSRLITSVRQSEPFSNLSIQCWTDSTIVLSWLNKHASHWHTYSSWNKLLRVTVILQRFIKWKFKSDTDDNIRFSNPISAKELGNAEIVWYLYIQGRQFQSEIQSLKTNSQIAQKSKLKSLNPFLDNQGLLRVGGRLDNSDFAFESKHPIILENHFIVKLLIWDAHEKTIHGGLRDTLSHLRQLYWIIHPRPLIKSILHKCFICVKYRAKLAKQLMANLPRPRVVRPERAFIDCGIDYAGPLQVRMIGGRGNRSQSCYIAVFVCFAVKAIHLEIVTNYTSSAFIAAFQRFVSLRGLPQCMYSDCGTNFQGANKELRVAFENAIKSSEFKNLIAKDRIEWRFNPPAAPHFGGLWESSVKSMKTKIVKIFGPNTPTYEELATAIYQISAILNSRPLTPITEHIDDFNVLTPAHFLIGSSFTAFPQPSLCHLKQNQLSRWQHMQQCTEIFWKKMVE